jgi:hypothetical protein
MHAHKKPGSVCGTFPAHIGVLLITIDYSNFKFNPDISKL